MLRFLDSFLNKFTMYQLTLYTLIAYIAVAVLGGFFHFLPYSPVDILIQTGFAVIVGLVSNFVFAKLFGAVTNVESVYITSLILVLIVPVKFPQAIPFIITVAGVAMASKYLATIEKRHVFNPAAVAVLAVSLLSPEHTATWWIGTPFMAPFMLVGGLLIMRKIQREKMVITFFASYFLILAAITIWRNGTVASVFPYWWKGITESSLLFFGFIMFTEPLTSPATKKLQEWYAYVVAALFVSPQVRLLSFTLSPEMALCAGNVFSYFISPNYRLVLPLSWKKSLGSVGIFAFTPAQQVNFTPGQYMEWTLPHAGVDARGNRRYFSIGSSPTEKELLLSVKFYNPSSSYKKALASLSEKDEIIAANLSGDFTLPKDLTKPLVFIAGGIGIVPFRSMIKYISDKNLTVNIVLLYADHAPQNFVFSDIFANAARNGVRTVYTITDTTQIPPNWQWEKGYITGEMIQRVITDFEKRTFYLSGPQLMVERYVDTLRKLNLPSSQIKQDFFPGYSEK